MTHSDEPRLDRHLRRGLMVAGAILLLAVSLVLYRVAMVLQRVEQSVATVARDLEAISRRGVELADRLSQLGDRLERLEQKSATAIGLDELELTLDQVIALREQTHEPGSLDAAGEQEVSKLLHAILRSGAQFESAGERDSATKYYVKCFAKYRTFKSSLRSAEDFIDKLASTSISGEPYTIVLPDERREPVALWLHEQLAQMRDP